MPKIRIVAWNIEEGMHFIPDQMAALNSISACLSTWNPDIVLLNEICVWNSWTNDGIDQITWLAQRGGYEHVHYTKTATLLRQGAKFVAVLSRIPLLSRERHQHSAYWDGGGYATLHVTVNINDRKHHIFSTRFTAHDVPENLRSHRELLEIVAAIPNDEAVIIGGDFNTGAGGHPNLPASAIRTVDFKEFETRTQTRHVFRAINWTNEGFFNPKGERVWFLDHLFVRGPYDITLAEPGSTNPHPSDHFWLFAELTPLEIETVAPITAVCPREDEILVAGIAKTEQSGRVMYAQWAPGSGWRGWTPFDVEYGSTQGFLSFAAEGDLCYLLWIGPDGWVYYRVRAGDGQWWVIWLVGNSNAQPLNGVPGGAVHGVSCQPGMLHVFYSNAQGRILFARHDGTRGGIWPEHGGLSGGSTLPGGHVTAVSRRQGQLDVFCVGTDGGVYTTSWSVGRDWAAWTRIGTVIAFLGNYVNAVSRNTDKIDIFVVDLMGRTMTAAWEPAQGWSSWVHIQNGVTTPRGSVTAVSRGPDLLDIFTRGVDGRVYSAASGAAGGWAGWWPINDARTVGPVWPVTRSRDKLDIFFTAPDGHIQTAAWPVNGGWGVPRVVSERWEVNSVSPITAACPREDEILVARVATAEQSSRVMYDQWTPKSGWQGWTPFTEEYGSTDGFLSLALEGDRCYLLWIGPDGWVYYRERAGDGQWSVIGLFGRSNESLLNGLAGGAVHGVSCQPGMLHVFYSNAQGRIAFAHLDTTANNWAEHRVFSSSFTSPGGHVTAVSRRRGQLDLFCVGTNGIVYTTSWSVGGDWAAWTRIGAEWEICVLPGNYVGAVSRNTDKIDIFVVDLMGRTWTAAWEPAQGWSAWVHIQNGVTTHRGWVTAVSRGPDLLDIFTGGIDGRVYTAASSTAGDWRGWWPINDARTIGPVWPVSRSGDKLDIFFTAPGGHIQTAAWPVNGTWGGPWVVSELRE